MDKRCRCGHDSSSAEQHPCHAEGYTCREPSTQRFYDARPVSLAGMQLKLQVRDTWACDKHWEEFKALLEQQKAK